MKKTKLAAIAATSLTIYALALMPAFAQTTNPSIPVGSLTAFPTVVQTGTKPTLTWKISYPSVVENYVTVRRPSVVAGVSRSLLTLKEPLICDIRILGAGVTTQASNGSIVFIRTAGLISYNFGSTWTTIFDGKHTDTIVQQQAIIKTINGTTNQTFDFGGKYYYNNAWGTFYTSKSGDNVRALVNGETPPSNIPDYNAPSLESFLKPYLDASGKVKIGPMDVIIFMELTHTDKTNIGYDLQDLAFLVTFRKP